jgi:hypothetical protein
VGQSVRRDSLDMFSSFKDFVEERNVETSDTEIDRWIKDDFINLHSRISKYFPEAVNTIIMDLFSTDSPQN